MAVCDSRKEEKSKATQIVEHLALAQTLTLDRKLPQERQGCFAPPSRRVNNNHRTG
jgi:hypothetical protein